MNSQMYLRNSYQRSKRMVNFMFAILAIQALIIGLAFFGGYACGYAKHNKDIEEMIERYYDTESKGETNDSL